MSERYDVFITYRAGADFAYANALYDIFKRCEVKPALDCYDFSPAETFLDEMARCVSESRYTIALITPRYTTSQFTQEESIMQKILDNREKKRRLIVTYAEDHPAPLWMQSLVGVRLFRDKGDKRQPELKRLLRLLLTKGSPSEVAETEVDALVEQNWRKLPADVLRLGLYGAAGYGILSAIADLDLDTARDGAVGTVGEALTSGMDHAHDHVVDHVQGAAHGIGRVIKNIFDDIF